MTTTSHPTSFRPAGARPGRAVAFMLLAAFLIAVSTFCAKLLGTDLLGDPLHPIQVTHGRFAFALLAIGGVAVLRGHLPSTMQLPLHLARTLCGATGVTLMFAAVAMIPLADATAISFLNPVFAMVLAIFILGEKVGPWRWGAATVAFFGTVILLRPGLGVFEIGAFLALAAALALGLEITIIKRLSGREPALNILLINNLIGFTLASAAVLFVWSPPTLTQLGALAGVGLFMAGAQTCYVNALARAEASFVVPFSYATLIFAAGLDYLVFRALPGPFTVLGSALIIGAGIVLAWREGRPQALRR
ncbi:MAG: DMT family transporter [Pseudomonadota bacterium]